MRRFKKRKRPKKARRWFREGKVPCVLNQEDSFFGSRVLGFWETRLVWISAPTRLSLQGSHVRRKFWKRTNLRSESSTIHMDYSTQVEDPAANVARKAALSPWSEAWARKLSYDKRQSTFFLFTSLKSSGGFLLGLYCVAWLSQESVSSRIFVKRNEKPTRSVQGTWGGRYEVLTLRN
jgi:hypothetical protein